jgi:hypothetical protein
LDAICERANERHQLRFYFVDFLHIKMTGGMEECLEWTHFATGRPHGAHIVFVLGLEHLDDIDREGVVASALEVDAGPRVLSGHGEIKLILVPQFGAALEGGEPLLLGAVVASTVDIVFVFLEDAETGSVRELGAFLVVSRVNARHGTKKGKERLWTPIRTR